MPLVKICADKLLTIFLVLHVPSYIQVNKHDLDKTNRVTCTVT